MQTEHRTLPGPLAGEASDYLTFKRKRLTPASQRGYTACLRQLVDAFPARALGEFEPPAGTALVEAFLSATWGGRAPRTYNKNFSIVHDFFEWAVRSGRLHGDPTLPIERARARSIHRTTFTDEQRQAVLAASPDPCDRVPLRLLFDYGLRKGALQGIRFEHFDHALRRLVVFTKGEKLHTLPIPDDAFWADLARLEEETAAQPSHYVLPRQRRRRRRPPNVALLDDLRERIAAAANDADTAADELASLEATDLVGHLRQAERALELARAQASFQVVFFPAEPIGDHGAHDWWYRCLERGGVVGRGVARGERMHKARHSAGQHVLDKTGNLKAVQKLLGHASIQTTGDTYTDWDIQQLEATLAGVVRHEAGLDEALAARIRGDDRAPR